MDIIIIQLSFKRILVNTRRIHMSYFNKANSYYNTKDYEKAINLYKKRQKSKKMKLHLYTTLLFAL